MAFSDASSCNTDATSLLKFIDTATCDIQDAMSKCGKSKRKLNMRKYISRNLKPAKKRLAPPSRPRPGPCATTTATTTSAAKKNNNNNSASVSTACAPVPQCLVSSQHSIQPWLVDTFCPTTASFYPSPYPSPPVQAGIELVGQLDVRCSTASVLDPDVRDILSEFSCNDDMVEPLSRSSSISNLPQHQHHHQQQLSTATSTSAVDAMCISHQQQHAPAVVSTCRVAAASNHQRCSLPHQSSLESQVCLGEYPYSPYSDCSDEILDSAYSSPSSCLSHHSPEAAAILCDWVGQGQVQVCSNSSSRSNSVCDQGLPSTPSWDSLINYF